MSAPHLKIGNTVMTRDVTSDIVVVLEVQWGYRGSTNGDRFFQINPRNFSGKRLIKLLGTDNFLVTNACPKLVASANGRGTPDASWLRANLLTLKPRLLVLCGKVAQSTFTVDMAPDARVVRLRHPAARTWTKEELELQRLEFIDIRSEMGIVKPCRGDSLRTRLRHGEYRRIKP